MFSGIVKGVTVIVHQSKIKIVHFKPIRIAINFSLNPEGKRDWKKLHVQGPSTKPARKMFKKERFVNSPVMPSLRRQR